MSVGTINVGNDSLAKNIGVFIQTIAGNFGITAKSSPEQARNLARELARPILKLFGGRVDTDAIDTRLSLLPEQGGLRKNPTIIKNPFEDYKFNQGLFLPNTNRPVIDDGYSFAVSQALEQMFADGDNLVSIARDLSLKLIDAGILDFNRLDQSYASLAIPKGDEDLGFNAPNYGLVYRYFKDDFDATNLSRQEKPNADAQGLIQNIILNIFQYAISQKQTMQALKALNRFIEAQYTPIIEKH
jgi:hypothetical protein